MIGRPPPRLGLNYPTPPSQTFGKPPPREARSLPKNETLSSRQSSGRFITVRATLKAWPNEQISLSSLPLKPRRPIYESPTLFGDDEMINISGLNKAAVLAALYNASKQQGMGVLDASGRSDMTISEAA